MKIKTFYLVVLFLFVGAFSAGAENNNKIKELTDKISEGGGHTECGQAAIQPSAPAYGPISAKVFGSAAKLKIAGDISVPTDETMIRFMNGRILSQGEIIKYFINKIEKIPAPVCVIQIEDQTGKAPIKGESVILGPAKSARYGDSDLPEDLLEAKNLYLFVGTPHKLPAVFCITPTGSRDLTDKDVERAFGRYASLVDIATVTAKEFGKNTSLKINANINVPADANMIRFMDGRILNQDEIKKYFIEKSEKLPSPVGVIQVDDGKTTSLPAGKNLKLGVVKSARYGDSDLPDDLSKARNVFLFVGTPYKLPAVFFLTPEDQDLTAQDIQKAFGKYATLKY